MWIEASAVSISYGQGDPGWRPKEVVVECHLRRAGRCGKISKVFYEELLYEAFWNKLVTLFHVVCSCGLVVFEPFENT